MVQVNTHNDLDKKVYQSRTMGPDEVEETDEPDTGKSTTKAPAKSAPSKKES